MFRRATAPSRSRLGQMRMPSPAREQAVGSECTGYSYAAPNARVGQVDPPLPGFSGRIPVLGDCLDSIAAGAFRAQGPETAFWERRSEERRVGKEVRFRSSP